MTFPEADLTTEAQRHREGKQRSVPQEGGTSSLRAPAHQHKSLCCLVGRRGEAPPVPPYVLCNIKRHGSVRLAHAVSSLTLRVGVVIWTAWSTTAAEVAFRIWDQQSRDQHGLTLDIRMEDDLLSAKVVL